MSDDIETLKARCAALEAVCGFLLVDSCIAAGGMENLDRIRAIVDALHSKSEGAIMAEPLAAMMRKARRYYRASQGLTTAPPPAERH